MMFAHRTNDALDHADAPWVVNQKKKDAKTAAATKEKDAKIEALTKASRIFLCRSSSHTLGTKL